MYVYVIVGSCALGASPAFHRRRTLEHPIPPQFVSHFAICCHMLSHFAICCYILLTFYNERSLGGIAALLRRPVCPLLTVVRICPGTVLITVAMTYYHSFK